MPSSPSKRSFSRLENALPMSNAELRLQCYPTLQEFPMFRVTVCTILSLFGLGSILADETPNEIKVSAKTEAVALFKNGYTVVRQEIDVPDSGIYRWEDVPAVIHGTFFIESDMNVEVRTTQRLVSIPVDEKNPPQLAAHQRVTVRTSTGLSFEGRIVDTTPAVETNSLLPELARSVARPRYDYYLPHQPGGAYPAVTATPLALPTPIVLKSSDGNRHYFLTGKEITSIETHEPITEHAEHRPVMLFHVTKNEGTGGKTDGTTGGGKIRLFYLTKGATWAPSYRIDVLDGKRLRIEQTAAIRNEGLPIVDTDISLVSGFPQIDSANVLSPLTPSQTLEQFFRQVLAQTQANLRGYRDDDGSFISNSALYNNGMMAQSVMPSHVIANAGFDTTALAAGEGPDIHYNSIGKRSLDTGDTLSLTVGKGEADYRRVLECDLSPHMLNNYNEIARNWHSWQNYNNRLVTPDVFDVLKFQNPLSFPMTTAPATVTEKSRFLGQSQSYWVNPQQVASIKITKVMNVAVTYSEKAEDMQPQAVQRGNTAPKQPIPVDVSNDPFVAPQPMGEYVADSKDIQTFRGYQCVKRKFSGTIEIVNRRNEEVTLHLTGLLLGKAEKVEPVPAKQSLSVKDYYPNDLSDLFWELVLKPGEAKTITISGTRWFRL